MKNSQNINPGAEKTESLSYFGQALVNYVKDGPKSELKQRAEEALKMLEIERERMYMHVWKDCGPESIARFSFDEIHDKQKRIEYITNFANYLNNDGKEKLKRAYNIEREKRRA